MDKKKIADTKNEILSLIQKKEVETIEDLRNKLDLEYVVVAFFVEMLSSDGFIEMRDITSRHTDGREYLFTRLTPKGAFFLNEEGGFITLRRKQRNENAWQIIRIVAGVLNAVAIIVISIWAVFQQTKPDNESRLKSLEFKVDQLEADQIGIGRIIESKDSLPILNGDKNSIQE